MASDVKQCNLNSSGDSSRCNSYRLSEDGSDTTPTNCNKTDGSGEHSTNIQKTNKQKTESKTRYINPAVHVETLTENKSLISFSGSTDDDQITPHPHTPYTASSSNLSESSTSSDGTACTRKSCKLPSDFDHSGSEDESPNYSKNITQRTYTGTGGLPNTFRLSVASLSTTSSVREEREQEEFRKKNAFRQWLARKEQEKRERAKQEPSLQNDQQLSEQQQRTKEENFRMWVEHKRKLSIREKAQELVRQAQLRQMEEEEQQRKERENKQKLKQWSKKKEAMKNERARRSDAAAARTAAEEEQRRAAGERAYRDWLRRSGRKPLPVPLNQGELSMRGTVSEMYINPIPWQSTT